VRIFERQVAAAAEAIPDCRGAPMLRALVRAESERLIPRELLAGSLRAVA